MNTQLNTALETALNSETDFATPINKLNTMNNIDIQKQQLLLQMKQEQQLQQQLQQQLNQQQLNQQQLNQQQLNQQQLNQQQLNQQQLNQQLLNNNNNSNLNLNQKTLSRTDVLAQLDEINNSPILLPNSNKIKNSLFRSLLANSYNEIIASILFFLLNSSFVIAILSKYFSKFDSTENPLYSLILRTLLFCVLFVFITRFIKTKFLRHN